MIKERDIEKFADIHIIQRGQIIQKAGGVLDFKLNKGGFRNIFWVNALVKGNNRRNFEVELQINEEQNEVFHALCDCSEFYEEEGLCKHCIAAMLEYIEHRDNPLADKPQIKLSKPTDPNLLQLMKLYAKRDQTGYMLGGMREQVQLEPYVTFSRYEGDDTVSFKIGIEYKYVLKNLEEFTDAVRNGITITYGQKLQFVHHPEAFKRQTQPLVKFLLQEIHENYFYYDSRELSLTEDNLDDFMEALGGGTFACDVSGFRCKEWHIIEDSYDLEASVSKEEEGYLLHFGKLFYRYGRKYCYFFQKDGTIIKAPREAYQDIWELMREMSGAEREYYIAAEEMPLFARDMLPKLEKHGKVKQKEVQLETYLPATAEYEFYLDAPQTNVILCKAYAVYGRQKYDLFTQPDVSQQRDIGGELSVSEEVKSYFTAYYPKENAMTLTEDEDRLYWLMTQGIPRMQELGTVYLSDAIKAVEINQFPKVTMGVSVANGMLTMVLDSPEMPLEQLGEVLSRYDRKKKYYRLKDGTFLQVDEELQLLADLKTDLNITDSAWKSGRIEVPKFRALYLEEALREKELIQADRSREFRALIRNMKTVEENDFELPGSLKPILREYQKTGYRWIRTLMDNGFGGILADDMGLGKTLQVITVLQALKEEGKLERALIVTPASLVYNWISELKKFAPGLTAVAVAGTQAERQQLFARMEEWDILITSYDLLKRDVEQYGEKVFTVEIIDEAQYIKNANTQAASAVKAIRAAARLALTGTPVENRLSELWSIFDYLMPGFLYPYTRFRRELEIPIVNGEEEKLHRLQRMIRPFVLRRMKGDVLHDLPDKVEESICTRLEGEQRELYDAHVQRLRLFLEKQTDAELAGSKIQILSELTKLRQLCCSPELLYENYQGESAKLELCMQYLRNAVSGGHKVLLFSQFTSVLELVQKRLEQEQLSYYLLTGQTGKQQRLEMVEAFQTDEVPIFLVSLKAGGTGLNLTAADIVMHFDPWWNVAAQNQATDRAHRIGQKNKVTVYKLIASDTIEERIVELQEKKQELASQLLSGDSADTFRFSREELLELLR